MRYDARRRVGGRPWASAAALLLLLCTESRAQQRQWTLGVWTETISEEHAIVGDPPGGMRRGPGTVTVYMLRITGVVAGSAADRAGLRRGDIIESVNGRQAKTPSELTRLVRGSNGVLDLDLKGRNGRRSKKIDLRKFVAAAAVETFVPHIGIYYEKVPNSDGTFGARLTRNAVQGSPATRLRMVGANGFIYLERDDTILEMDGQRFRTHDDVRNHRFETTMRFIDSRTGRIMNASLTLP